jgi:replicative DNA helicase
MAIQREKIILRNLQYNETFARKVLPHMREEYFLDDGDRLFFSTLYGHFAQYNSLPNYETMIVSLDKSKANAKAFDAAATMAEEFHANQNEPIDEEWLTHEAEEFCQDIAYYNAIIELVKLQKEGNRLSKTAAPKIMESALAVSFNTDVGHDYLKNSDERYTYYTTKANKIPCHLGSFNAIMNGGADRKKLHGVMARTGLGKTIMLCDLAANYMKAGYNVLYITLEMADMDIGRRIDANLMDININDIEKLPKIMWDEKASAIRNRCAGKLIIKEYPTKGASVANFKLLLEELKQKQNFKPDVIMVDYLNICASALHKNVDDSNGYLTSVTEEIRGMLFACNAVGWTGLQFNRTGMKSSDADMEDTAAAIGITFTIDFVISLTVNEELIKNGQVMVKQLKNRVGDQYSNQKFVIGIDRPKMRFYELSNSNVSWNKTSGTPPSVAPNAAATKTKATGNTKGVKI